MSKTAIILNNSEAVNLRYDFSALTRLEDEAQINLFDKNALKRLSPSTVRDLLWAGMLAQKPELTRAEAAKLISLEKIDDYSAAIVAAVDEAMPAKKKK